MKFGGVFAPYILLSSLLSGCVTTSDSATWGINAHWSNSTKITGAAKRAITSPDVWVPALTAGLLLASDVDDKWSRDLADDQPLFGDDAEKTSSSLRDVATGAYVITALLAPSPNAEAKVRGLAAGLATSVADGLLNEGLKRLSSRERPDGTNDNSMPSGHASKAASRTYMARYNLTYIDMPAWARHTTNWALHGVAVGTGLARVEGRKHHLSDVFVGYALGNFVARVIHEAFFVNTDTGAQVSFAPVDEGGAFTLTLPL